MSLNPRNNYSHISLLGVFLIYIILSACYTSPHGINSSGEDSKLTNTQQEHNKSIVLQWVEARNMNDLETALKLWSDDKKDGLAKAFNRITQAFPNVQVIVEDMLAEGNSVALRWTLKGTHQGMYQNISATGRQVTWKGIDIYTIADGKIASLDRASDWCALLVQIGDDFQPQSVPYYQKLSENTKPQE